MQAIGGQRGHAGDQQQQHGGVREPQAGQAVEREGQRQHGDGQQQVASDVEAADAGQFRVRHIADRGNRAEQADRHVDQEDPVPRQRLRQPAAQRGADQRADHARDGDEAKRLQVLFAREGAQHREPADRQQHGAAHALHHARADQEVERGRVRAQQRAGHEQADRSLEDGARAEAVGEPARGGDDHRHGQRVGDHHGLHPQRALAQAARHRRQGGVDDGRVQRLHEEADRHDPQHDAAGTVVRRWHDGNVWQGRCHYTNSGLARAAGRQGSDGHASGCGQSQHLKGQWRNRQSTQSGATAAACRAYKAARSPIKKRRPGAGSK
ncbi:hypothetical protein D9M72_372240 [compost metagenome]